MNDNNDNEKKIFGTIEDESLALLHPIICRIQARALALNYVRISVRIGCCISMVYVIIEQAVYFKYLWFSSCKLYGSTAKYCNVAFWDGPVHDKYRMGSHMYIMLLIYLILLVFDIFLLLLLNFLVTLFLSEEKNKIV